MEVKNKRKISRIWGPTRDEMQQILDSHDSYSDVMRYFGMNPHNGSIKTLYTRIKEDKLDDSNIKKKKWIQQSIKNIPRKEVFPDNEVFIENSTYSRAHLKKRIIKKNIIPYKCDKCGNNGEWMNEKISLQLEHKNGVSNDHRIENLCFLCPNCHTQTKTYAGKNAPKRNAVFCVDCGVEIYHTSKRCKNCSRKRHYKFQNKSGGIIYRKTKIEWPDKKTLCEMIWSVPTVEIAKELGVSDSAITKHCRINNIPKPPRGYWNKMANGKIKECDDIKNKILGHMM